MSSSNDETRLRLPSAVALALLAACGSSDSKVVDAAPKVADAKVVDAGQIDAPPPADAGPDAKPGFTLHLANFDGWCDVNVDGTIYTASSPPDTVYDPGTVVTLFAFPTTTSNLFEWGYWTGTDGQRDGGVKDTDQHATVTMSQDQTVTACCPFSSTGTGC